MSRFKVDYELLEKEYIAGDMSVRELAKRHDVAWSAVNAQKNKREWDRKRDEYRYQRSTRMVEKMAESYADQRSQIRDEVVQVLRAALYKFAGQLKDESFKVYPKDLAVLVDKLMLLLGEPTSRTEANILGLNFTAEGLSPELLRDLAELTRGARSTGTGVPAPVRTEGPRPN